MKYPANMPVICTSQEGAIANYGDAIWFDLCDEMPTGKWFKPRDLVGRIRPIAHLSKVTQLNYLRAVLTAVRLNYQSRPDDYDGHVPLETRGCKRVLGYRL